MISPTKQLVSIFLATAIAVAATDRCANAQESEGYPLGKTEKQFNDNSASQKALTAAFENAYHPISGESPRWETPSSTIPAPAQVEPTTSRNLAKPVAHRNTEVLKLGLPQSLTLPQGSFQRTIDRSGATNNRGIYLNQGEAETAARQHQPIVQNAALPNHVGKNQTVLSSFDASKPSRTTARPNETSPPNVASQFQLAGQPPMRGHRKGRQPKIDSTAFEVEYSPYDFSPDPIDPTLPYDGCSEQTVYDGKSLYANRRPLIEIGRPWYQLGQLSAGNNILGDHNLLTPQFIVFGDLRAAYASNTQAADNVSQFALELNLDFDLKLTSTERLHMFISPLDRDGRNTRLLLDENDFVSEFDPNVEFGYFEGDLGAIWGGAAGQTLPFDLPFTVGFIPMFFQNGIWMEDAFVGVAATIPARNSRKLDISNMDTTFFFGFDDIDNPAFEGDDNAAKIYGVSQFIDAMNGYLEMDYAYLEDRAIRDRSHHSIGLGYSRRYGRFVSNSVRMIASAGQSTNGGPSTADGVLFLMENSFITSAPSTFVPYFNLFAGFDRPQSAARDAQAGGILRNTGILFESDGMTAYPTLDATGNDAYGGAVGLNILARDFSQQLVLEAALLQVHGNDANRNAPGDQYGLGFRYQIPISNAVILRFDGMYGFLDRSEDVQGLRFEVRHKF